MLRVLYKSFKCCENIEINFAIKITLFITQRDFLGGSKKENEMKFETLYILP